MDKQRRCEIGYLLLLQQLQRDGIISNVRFKDQLDKAASTLGISPEEVAVFATFIARDLSEMPRATP